MTEKILIELKSYRDDGKFFENETDEELSLEQAVDCVIAYWGDMGSTYYSWDCEKVVFKECGDVE